jgi:hypothetical protein
MFRSKTPGAPLRAVPHQARSVSEDNSRPSPRLRFGLVLAREESGLAGSRVPWPRASARNWDSTSLPTW